MRHEAELVIKNKSYKMEKVNPIIEEVVNRYKTIQNYTSMFTNGNESAIRGLLISGDAGFGKTHFTKLGLGHVNPEMIDYVKGSSISAAALYVKLFMNRFAGQVLILDDVDIINKTKAEFALIIEMLKGATEPTKGERTLAWSRAQRNQLMVENDVPDSFDFNGTIIWITNERVRDIAEKCGSHWNALDSRFYKVEAWLNDQEKLMYTLYLVEDIDMLGKECYAKEGGYSKNVIEKATKYLRDNYKYMYDFNSNSTLSPRSAVKLADTITNFADDWKMMANMQFIKIK
jgi:hypothetical protein